MELLSAVEVRVLGCLVEKEITTPDYYPMSLNALVNACNQKSNREPVMELAEDQVQDALSALNRKGMAWTASGVDSRVPKYEHRLESFNFGRRETALLCVLWLRGAQTPGELRGRAERLFRFEELSDVQSTLQKLMDREPALVKVLPRQAGMKEARYVHLFSGELEEWAAPVSVNAPVVVASANEARIVQLEEAVAALRAEMRELKERLAGLL